MPTFILSRCSAVCSSLGKGCRNPDLVTYIKGAAIGAGVAIIVSTIIEDFLTLGAGIADDWLASHLLIGL